MTPVGQIVEAGLSPEKAKKVLIMLHGRGATAQDILSLTGDLQVDDFYITAPQAPNNKWYPYSFLSPVSKNEPWLSNAINQILQLTSDLGTRGFESQQIYFLGFSQGACLSLEFASRYARHWGGIIAFSGGLIGDTLHEENYHGNFGGTKVFIGNSDMDPHIPLSRSQESARIMEKLGAVVELQIYPGMGHYVNQSEIEEANLILHR
jgi:phospholipase/carboxylesterase